MKKKKLKPGQTVKGGPINNGFFTFTAEEREAWAEFLCEDARIVAKRQELQNQTRDYQMRQAAFWERFTKRVGVKKEQIDTTTITPKGISIKK